MSEAPMDWEHVDARHEWRTVGGAGAESNLRRCPICHSVVPRFYQTEHLIWHDLNDVREILREYGLHEPSCPAREVEKQNQQGGVYFMPVPCTCWLSREKTDE